MSDTTKTVSGSHYRVTHSVGPNQAGIRLDRFLMDRYPKRSRERIKKIIDSGAITVIRENAPHQTTGRIKASLALQPHDIVQVLSVKRPEPEVNFDYKILFEDEHILVIEKPPNLPVHPAGRFFFHTLLIHLKTQGFRTDLKSERNYFLVHRIDKETSGILLLAKSKESCNALTAQFRNRETEKYYLAIVRGEPKEAQFRVTASIGKPLRGKINLRMVPLATEQGGLESETLFEKIETRSGKHGVFTLLACFPRTGRQHQIRVHAETAGYPLVGDKIYGMSDEEALALLDGARDLEASQVSPQPVEDAEVPDADAETEGDPEESMSDDLPPEDAFEIPGPTSSRYAEVEARLLIERHALHAAGLRFRHPVSNETLTFESDLPKDLREFFESLEERPLAPFRTKHW